MLLQAVKRARSPDAETGPAKRKVRSCDTCRRLKTRCEIQTGSMVCHRCSLLRLECSLDGSTNSRTPTREAASPKTQENHSQPCPHSDCNQRLLAVEASLAEVKALLDSVLHAPGRSTSPEANRDKAKSRNNELPETGNITSPKQQHQHSGPLVADRNSRTAPMSLIRDMKQHILGRDRGWHDMELSEDIVKKGIITEELTQTLLSGFTQLSRRWLFMRPLPAAIRQTSPLLFASCVLAGLHINPSLHGSETHHQLYQHVSTLLSKSMIVSPLSLEAIQSMLIFSMWNLVPNKDAEHLDTWLLSGIAGMHGMLAINFEKLVQTRPDGLVDPRSRETLRSWNLICLCHLQFSVGTGRPPVLSRQYLNQCETILSLPSYNFRDQLVAAGVKLYDSLCCLVNSDTVQTDSLVWEEIDDWKKSCGQFYELDSSKPLRFAYSCSYLILARRTLKHLSEEPAKDPIKTTNGSDLDPTLFFQLAVEHAHRILNLFLAMSDLTAFVRPAYENLLCSFAMVTLSEFATYLEDVDATLALMEKTSLHVQLGGKAEPVSKWALNVLRKYVFDLKRASAQDQIQQQDGGDFGVATDQGFGSSLGGVGNMALPNDFESSEWGVDQDFPSLEDMFVGN